MASAVDHQPTTSCHVVAMPYPGHGHINPMLSLCHAVAEQSRRQRGDIRITFVVTEEWLGLIDDKPPGISFATIPNVLPSEHRRGEDLYGFIMAVLTKMEEPFERLLDELLMPPSVIVADAFLPWAAEVASRRNIPVAHLWSMSVSVYTLFYHFDLLVQNGHFPVDSSANEDGIVDYIPGLSPIHIRDLPTIFRDQQNTTFFLNILPQPSKSSYLIFSSIYGLESQVINALKQQSQFSIFNVGPFTSYSTLNSLANHGNDNGKDESIKWLDLRPPGSVLYVSLGSHLSASAAQMDEIAYGLCNSGVSFLWVSRGDIGKLQAMSGEKGLVVAWCNQLRVLSHPSVGGFWSHCGWNSTKEALLAGIPILASPILMDQLPNAKAIVEDWKIGWRVGKGVFGEDVLVNRDEISKLVWRFMDSESSTRSELVGNARKLKSICELEFTKDQSLEANIDCFIESIKQNVLH